MAIHPFDPPGGTGVAAAGQLVLINEGVRPPPLHPPYMGEVISEAEQHHINGNMEIRDPGIWGGYGSGRPGIERYRGLS